MLTYALERPARSTMMNKVPEITLFFWTIKVLSTTVGETAADLLAVRVNRLPPSPLW